MLLKASFISFVLRFDFVSATNTCRSISRLLLQREASCYSVCIFSKGTSQMVHKLKTVEKEEAGFPRNCFPMAVGCLFVNLRAQDEKVQLHRPQRCTLVPE